MKCFHFLVWSISHNCLLAAAQNETYFGHFDRKEILFWVRKCHVDTIRNEIIRKETFAHAFISSKRKWLALWNGPFSWTTPEKKFHFISPAVKSNINRHFFYVGLKFHFGSHVNTLLVQNASITNTIHAFYLPNSFFLSK